MVLDLARREESRVMPSGVKGFISFDRLIKTLRDAGEFRDGEIVTHIEINATDPVGMTFRVEYKR